MTIIEYYFLSDNLGNQWNAGQINIAEPNSQYYILIEGITGPGYLSDIALDEISLSPNACS